MNKTLVFQGDMAAYVTAPGHPRGAFICCAYDQKNGQEVGAYSICPRRSPGSPMTPMPLMARNMWWSPSPAAIIQATSSPSPCRKASKIHL